MSDTTFDYIIIGGGTAGALLCNRLSADSNRRVLLIEAGRKDDYHWIHIPVGYLYCIGNPRTDWLYQTEPDAGLNGRSLRYPRGKTLGGCSSINGMIYMRGQARDYDQWAQLTGDDEWRWDNVLPAFRRHEDHWRLDQPDGVNENFKRLHVEGAISVGIIVTRGRELQAKLGDFVLAFARRHHIGRFDDLTAFGVRPTDRQRTEVNRRIKSGSPFAEAWAAAFCSDKFGQATTHWRKLEDRVRRGVGNPCPLLLIGIPATVVDP